MTSVSVQQRSGAAEGGKGLSTEIRVGLLILIATALLVGFVLVLGGVDFGGGHTVYVDFDNPGNVKPGASVNIGGMKVGTVEDIEYRGGRLDPQTGRRSLIRLRLDIDDEVKDTIHEDALFYVTAQSVLGEQIVAIDPGNPEAPPLAENSIVRGVDPPRLDLALALGYELLDTLVTALRNNREELNDLLGNLSGIVRGLNDVLTNHRERIDRIIVNVETATAEAAQLAQSARGTIDGPEVRRIVTNLDRTLGAVARDIEPILADVRTVASNANEALGAVGPEERERIRTAIRDASRAVADAQQIVAHIRQGRGTVGAIVMDEEIYDDLQELLRDLKHNPWKFFWRE